MQKPTVEQQRNDGNGTSNQYGLHDGAQFDQFVAVEKNQRKQKEKDGEQADENFDRIHAAKNADKIMKSKTIIFQTPNNLSFRRNPVPIMHCA
jgi:hypothetical protein